MNNTQRETNLANHPELLALHYRGIEHDRNADDPTPENLGKIWSEEYSDQETMLLPNDMLGVMRKPSKDENLWALLSYDLDEVVRASIKALLGVADIPLDENTEGYDEAYDLPFGTITHALGALMHEGSIGPVEGIEEITSIIRKQRENGAFVIANTSTHPKCERPTVRFLQEYLPDCFDGIVFPRNFDGMGAHNKGLLKEAIYLELESVENNADRKIHHVQHIDDSLHHLRDTRDAANRLKIPHYFDIVPKYYWNSTPPEGMDVYRVDTPLEAFQASERVFYNLMKGL